MLTKELLRVVSMECGKGWGWEDMISGGIKVAEMLKNVVLDVEV